jgi:pimeloyl-ACP methyl ester carboxylesterase
MADVRSVKSPTKPLLILIHGGALSSSMFRTTTPHLSTEHFSILIPDLPGHGPSATSTGPFTFDTSYNLLTELVLTARTADSTQKIILIGVSLGGQVVLDYLQRHQHACTTSSNNLSHLGITGTIVASAPILPPSETCPWEMPHLPTDPQWQATITTDVSYIPAPALRAIQDASFAFHFEPLPAAAASPSSADADTSSPTPLRPSQALPPILLITGEHDVAMAKRDVGEIARRIEATGGRVETRVLQGAWHNHPMDVPEIFAGIITDWVRHVCD